MRIIILFVSFMTVADLYSQCPIVNDTFYINVNTGLPIYISYLRKVTDPTVKYSQNDYVNNGTNYAWAHGNLPLYPQVNIEQFNKHYLNGTPDTGPSYIGNLTKVSTSSYSAGTYLDMGVFNSVGDTLRDRVAKLSIPVGFYGWAYFDYYYQSCAPKQNFICTDQGYSCSVVSYQVGVTGVTTWDCSYLSLVSVYPCSGIGGECSSYSPVNSVCSSTYQSWTPGGTSCENVTYCIDGTMQTVYSQCNDGSARSYCTKRIYLYVRNPDDIKLTKNCSKSTYAANELVEFTINVSSEAFSGIFDSGQVVDLLPAGLLFVSYSATGGTYNPTTGKWLLPPIGNGRSYTLKIKALATETKSYTNTATFSYYSGRADGDLSNNSMSCSFNAVASPIKPGIKPSYDCGISVAGVSPVCADSTGLFFSVNPIPVYGTTYTWTVPSGYTIQSGQGTNAITVKSGTNSGVISANVFIPATDSTSATTCERSFPVSINMINSNIRITKN